jgi:YidC/Oxa1 family membrane protein insertase
VSIFNPLYDAVAWIIMRIHAVLAVPFGASSGWAWGLSIVILVVLMRLLLLPLFVKQVRAQRKMVAVAPQLQELRKRYKGDRQKMNEETMKFYKEAGVNPLGGCLPLVGQFPVFIALFGVLRAISDWTPGHVPQYGLTVPVVASAQKAHIFGVSLADKFLFAHPAAPWHVRIVILLTVAVSATTTYLTMRQSARRGMMQTSPDPDNPMAQSQKYMMYIAPFFALTGLYWQYGLVIYWVTTNVWTLGQQYFMFRNMPIVGSAGVGAAAVQAANGRSTGSAAARTSSGTGKAGGAARTGTRPGGSARPGGGSARTGAARQGAAGANSGKTSSGTGGSGGSGGSGRTGGTGGSGGAQGTGRGLLRLGKNKPEPEPEPEPPPVKVVRQQPVRQSRSKRSGNKR